MFSITRVLCQFYLMLIDNYVLQIPPVYAYLVCASVVDRLNSLTSDCNLKTIDPTLVLMVPGIYPRPVFHRTVCYIYKTQYIW